MSSQEEKLFLGLDSSTQSLKLLVIDQNLKLLNEWSTFVVFDDELPHYKTKGGAIRDSDGLTITTPTLLWVEALDLLLQKLKEKNFPFSKVVAISGSGQQHGSVYWKKGTRENILKKLKPNVKLIDQLKDGFSIKDSPIWMDSSTSEHCKALEEKMGGPHQVSNKTGSRCYERFTGQQIAKISRKYPSEYKNTERISLVSSFMCSLLIGDYAPIDYGDGSGMNLMHYQNHSWIPEALAYAGENLGSLLGDLSPGHGVAGKISSYFVETFGFSEECRVVVWSGDNPCSVAGLCLDSGDVAVSLGTSDTVFATMADPNPSPEEGHVFCNPVDPSLYMSLICYKNGSLTREDIRDKYASGSWDKFTQILQKTPPGNDKHFGFFFKEAEITPRVSRGYFRFIGDKLYESSPDKDVPFPKSGDLEEGYRDIRAVIEGQFISMYLHANKVGVRIDPKSSRVLVTGGASLNSGILQVLSDVFGVPVLTGDVPNSACLGACYRAFHGFTCFKEGKLVPFFSVIGKDKISFKVAASPNPDVREIYQKMVLDYSVLEQKLTKI